MRMFHWCGGLPLPLRTFLVIVITLLLYCHTLSATYLRPLMNFAPIGDSGDELQLFTEPSDQRLFLYHFFHYFSNVSTELSDDCVRAVHHFATHRDQEWAIQMVDANAVLESGVADGNLQFFGSFDQCLALRIPSLNNTAAISNELLQYCTVSFPISLLLNTQEVKAFPSFITTMLPSQAGICIPAACTSQSDLPNLLARYSQMSNTSARVTNCVTKDAMTLSDRFHWPQLVISVVYLTLLLFCIVGTLMELLYCTNSIEKNCHWLCRILCCFSWKRNFKFLFKSSDKKVPCTCKRMIVENANGSISTQNLIEELNKVDNDSNDENDNHRIQRSGRSFQPAPSMSTTAEVGCLHGIRVLSFVFILVYHTFTEAQTPSANLLQVLAAERNFTKQLITNATLWVDTFFLLSGFLVSHHTLHRAAECQHVTVADDNDEESEAVAHCSECRPSSMQQLRRHPKRLLHRYLRLTPSVAAVLSLSILIEALGTGPLWSQYVENSKQTCQRNWWTLFLYVNNICQLNQINRPASECLAHLWYLAVDMQFFLVSPLLLMFLVHKNRRIQMLGVVVNLVTIGTSWALTAILMCKYQLTPTVLVNVYDLNYINLVYKTAYCRIGPYCVGILLAYTLNQFRPYQKVDTIEQSAINIRKMFFQRLLGVLWLTIASVLMLTITLLTYPWLQEVDYHNSLSAIIYGSIHRTIWALVWALLIGACVRGQLPLVNRVFSNHLSRILSKLTYQSYLLHLVLISAVVHTARQKIFYSDTNFVFEIFKYWLLTTLTSVATYVTFERPFINMEQLLF